MTDVQLMNHLAITIKYITALTMTKQNRNYYLGRSGAEQKQKPAFAVMHGPSR